MAGFYLSNHIEIYLFEQDVKNLVQKEAALNKKIYVIIFILLVFGLTVSKLSASVRVLTHERSDLRLFEKCGRIENLLDNPARLMDIREIIVDQYTDIRLNNSKPYDTVFEKSRHDEELDYTVQALAPLADHLAVNLGYRYIHQLLINQSTSRVDGTFIRDGDKTFYKNINAAVATDLLPDIVLGYSLTVKNKKNFVELVSDLASNYTYLNSYSIIHHTVGLVSGEIGLYAGFESEKYLGKYNGAGELDFEFTTMVFQARYILGEAEGENLTSRISYKSQNLNQRQFEMGRSGYQLDMANYCVSADSYYFIPWERLEFAAGVEVSYENKNIFDLDSYRWENYQVHQFYFPAMLRTEILPFLRAWIEMNLCYSQNTYEESNSITLQRVFGLQFAINSLEINLYTMPTAGWITSQTADDIQALETGLDIHLGF